ncbi:endospore germination permease [Fodinisporobacter ferrooxydans]|uniref:Endospore germination permease n=1 Tax=Fodinisporobacter ferrooxydans TaxID=2901836 RepID=A0ABY4CJ20_9BACL|nr:endospore germination permease [Alicyclobacillaceae bacterium MYW30-H2]
MSKQLLSRGQWISIESVSLPMLGHFFLVGILIRLSGRDAWIAALASIFPGLLFAWIIAKCKHRFPNILLFESTKHALGRSMGSIVNVIYMFYFMFSAGLTFCGLEQFIATIFMPETPYWAIGGSFSLLIILSLYCGIEAIGRTAVVFFITILVTGTFVGINLIPEKDYSRLLPLLTTNWHEVGRGVLILMSTWSELLLVLFIQNKTSTWKSIRNGVIFIVILNGLLYTMMMASDIAVFGEDLAKTMDWPVQKEVRLLQFSFLDRLDIYGLFTVTAGCMIRIAIFLYGTCKALSSFLQKVPYQAWIIPVVCLIFGFSLLPFWNHARFEQVLETFYFYSSILMLFPFMVLAVSYFRHPKNRLKQNSNT